MPRLQAPLRRPWRAASERVIVLLGSLTGASCESLYGSYSMDNQDNCVVNAALCPAPEQVCNLSTKLCEPATLLTAVDPPSGSNLGGTRVTITGSRFADGMSVNIDGVPATSVVVTGAQQLTAITPARPSRQGPVTVELINPEGQHTLKDKLFRYYGGVAFTQKCFQGPMYSNQVVAADLNGDRKSDLLVASFTLVRPYLNSGDGQNFPAMADVTPSQTPLNVLAADVNGN